tara:strand:- start:47 stop:1174 length:1128 start_codon:yes stop_codon:yes gene_type:complete
MRVLIIPNYTNFGNNKDINRDSFLLVFKSFLDNTEIGKAWEFVLPVPDLNNYPGIINQFDYPNVKIRVMDEHYGLDPFPPKMRVDYKHKFFDNILQNERFNLIWSHLPEWTREVKISRIYSVNQPIVGYCHWWEIPQNGARTDNSFWRNVRGMLDMKVCGVNSNWVKQQVLKEASKDFDKKYIEQLDKIIQPWYLGCDSATPSDGYDEKTIVFNHREGVYTGSKWFFETMDALWKERQDFKVYTTLRDMGKPYTKYIGAPDRKVYLKQLSKAHFGVGCFQGYSAWSMSATDGFSVGVPYLLPNEFCYPEMVGKDYSLFYNGKKEFKDMVVKLLDGDIKRPDVTHIAESLLWENQLKSWDIQNNFVKIARTQFRDS